MCSLHAVFIIVLYICLLCYVPLAKGFMFYNRGHSRRADIARKESITQDTAGGYTITIPGYAGEKFDIQLDNDNQLHVKSLHYAYSKSWILPTSVDRSRITAQHLRRGIRVNVPIISMPMSKIRPGWLSGWEDPEGMLVNEPTTKDMAGIEIEEEDIMECYPKSIDAVDGYWDTRGQFRSY